MPTDKLCGREQSVFIGFQRCPLKLIGANQNWYRSEPHRAKTDTLPTYLERYYTAVGDPNDPRSKEKTGIKLDLPHTLREQAHDANKIKIRRHSRLRQCYSNSDLRSGRGFCIANSLRS